MSKKFEVEQGRGDFFKSLGTLLAGFVAGQVEEAITQVSPRLLRPPGALDEFAFLTACTRCDKCAEACPQDAILKAGPGAGLGLHTPYIEPRNMPCFLCSDLPCITACPEGALIWPVRKDQEGLERRGPEAVHMGTARVKASLCVTYGSGDREATACQTCVDRCPYPGVALRLAEPLEGERVGHPVVDPETCTGCGLCVFGCPTSESAIVVDPRR